MQEVKLNSGTNTIMYLVGNKADLPHVDFTEEIQALKSKYKFQYLKISAKTKENIQLLLDSICKDYLQDKIDINYTVIQNIEIPMLNQ